MESYLASVCENIELSYNQCKSVRRHLITETNRCARAKANSYKERYSGKL